LIIPFQKADVKPFLGRTFEEGCRKGLIVNQLEQAASVGRETGDGFDG